MCRTCGKRHNSYEADPSSNGPQDVSLEPAGSIPFSFGLRSPGKTSPMRGRNMKEYEEHLEHLKKENFALKLRIYFLEEKISHKGIKEDKEELNKANIELKVETEALKKELSDKQELVRQAAALLTNLETQFKDQLQAAKEAHERETQDLKANIAALQKDVDEYTERLRQDGGGDLTRLCGLAFSSGTAEEENELAAFCNPPSALSAPGMSPGGHFQGVFSLPDSSVGASPGSEHSADSLRFSLSDSERNASDGKRIAHLEREVERLVAKVTTLHDTLLVKEKASQALQEDVVNLKKEIEDSEEKVCDLELEVVEKDQKVDQLMQDLETRHREIQDKNSTIQTLHDDLNKVEPQIEVKVAEIRERDRLIEEKTDQLQQQNKILVEIQITLDEKQKQIAELEEALAQATQRAQKVDKDFDLSIQTIKEMAAEVLKRDKEIAQLKKEVKKKEKKVKDLLAELKEALDMLKKAKWEAETSGGQDGVKEMVEEENERLWAELEQRKLELKKVLAEKDSLLKERDEALRRQREEAEDKLLQKEAGGGGGVTESEVENLRKMMESRDALLRAQEVALEAMRADLASAKGELGERRDELKDLKKELARKNFDMQDFIAKELFGRSKEVKDLQEKLCGMSGCSDPLQELKLFMETNRMRFNPEGQPPKPPPQQQQQVQARSNSLSKLNEQALAAKTSSEKKDSPPSQPSPNKAGRSNSFSLLENALYAQMGQKVYNTNQTFNTYVLSGDGAETKPGTDVIPLNDMTPPNIATEALKMEMEMESTEGGLNPAKAFLASILSKEVGRTARGSTSPSKSEVEVEFCSLPQTVTVGESALQLLYQEVNNIRDETQALRKDREILNQKVAALQALNDQLCSDASSEQCGLSSLQRQLEEVREEMAIKDQVHGDLVSDYKGQIDILKEELKGVKRKVTLQLLQVASAKYQDSLKNYKQEIISLRKRLADSHNACDLLRNRLEELVDFLEQILDMDKKGIIDLSHLSSSQRASLQKSLDDSRSLSHSLSHSLMIGTDSLLGDTLSSLNDETASRFFLPLDNLTEEIDISKFDNSYASVADLINSETLNLDSTNDMCNLFADKINLHIDGKAKEIDDLASKLSYLSSVLESKDEQLRLQTDTLTNLEDQIVKLRQEIQSKDQLLQEAKVVSYNPVPEGSCSDLDSTLQSQNVSNCSLHLSTLQHSLPSPPFDPRLPEGIFTVPGETSSSDTLPPPPHYSSSQEDRKSFKANEKHSSLVNIHSRPSVPCPSDIGSAYSTDILVKSLPKLSDASFLKNSAEVPQQQVSRSAGMSLEQPALPPSLALASPSESEAWSEPDRNVSLARIGLEACNLVSASHDRSLSRSRLTRSAPFTSESECECNPEEVKEVSNGQGTPSNKPKRRSDAVEVKRLSSKLRTVEQLNETLRAELHIYQTLNDQFNVSSKEAERTPQADSGKELSLDHRDALMKTEESPSRRSSLAIDANCSLFIPSSLLNEIRSLRTKLEEAIANNDLLRDQLEAALSGYLSEETRNLSSRLSAIQQDLKMHQEKLLIATNAEEKLKRQAKENEAQMFELGERLAEYMTCNQKLEKKVYELNQELQESRETLRKTEAELEAVRVLREEKEWAQKEVRDSKSFQMELEINSLKIELKKLHQSEVEKEREMEERQKYTLELEEAKADYEAKLSEQDAAINELCQSITKLQQDNSKSSLNDQIISKLQDALQNSESRLLQVTKERFALVGERARLQAQLVSVTTHASLLQREVRELSVSEETSLSPDVESKQLSQRFKSAQTSIAELQKDKELFQSEKQATLKEMQLLQEEISALRSHLDHVLSREAVTNSREVRELASLQMKYRNLKEENESLETRCQITLSEKSDLEAKLREVDVREEEILSLKKVLKEKDVNREEILSQLDAEKCLTANLQMQIKSLQFNSSYHKVPSDSRDAGLTTGVPPRERVSRRGSVSPLKKSSSSSSWGEDKENFFPRAHSRGTPHSHLEGDLTSGESPDLGIGSDGGHFSSLERLGYGGGGPGGEALRGVFASGGRRKERSARLCSDPSHSQLFSELERLREERSDLSAKLGSTKESLKDALTQLSRANQKKESVERAICRQLTKTHDVLKRAKGNLRHAKGRSRSQTRSQADHSPPETG